MRPLDPTPRRTFWLLSLLLWAGVAQPTFAARAGVPLPKLTSEVVDEAGILAGGALGRVQQAVAELNQKKNIQLVVVTVPDLAGYAVEEYALAIADAWKLGKKGEDRGIILLIAPTQRRMRFEVGYGLEGELPDAITKRILADVITPEFRAGDYEGGVLAGVKAVRDILEGDWKPPQRQRSKKGLSPVMAFLILFFVGFIILGLMTGGGGGGGFRGGRRNDWWGGSTGGWSGGGGGGWGGGGGFSGGGGGFGGGGSSSSW